MLHQPWVQDGIRKRCSRVAVIVGRKSGSQAGHNRFSVVRISSPDCERALGLGAHCSTLSLHCGPGSVFITSIRDGAANSICTSQRKCRNSRRRPCRTAHHKGTAIHHEEIWNIMRLMLRIDQGHPLCGAGASTMSIFPVRARETSGILSMPSHSVARMNNVFLSRPPSMQAKQPR